MDGAKHAFLESLGSYEQCPQKVESAVEEQNGDEEEVLVEVVMTR